MCEFGEWKVTLAAVSLGMVKYSEIKAIPQSTQIGCGWKRELKFGYPKLYKQCVNIYMYISNLPFSQRFGFGKIVCHEERRSVIRQRGNESSHKGAVAKLAVDALHSFDNYLIRCILSVALFNLHVLENVQRTLAFRRGFQNSVKKDSVPEIFKQH